MRESMAGVPSGVSWRGSVSTSQPKAWCWTEPAAKAAGARPGTTSRIMSPRMVSRTVVGALVGEGVGAPVVGRMVGIMVMVGAAVPPPPAVPARSPPSDLPPSMVTPTAIRTAATTRTPAPTIMSRRRRLLGPPAAGAPSSFFLSIPPPPPLWLLPFRLFLEASDLLAAAPLPLPLPWYMFFSPLTSDVAGVWLDSTSPVAWVGARVSAAPANVSRVTLLVTDAKPKVDVSSIMLVTLASPPAEASPASAPLGAPYRSAAGSVAMPPAWAEPIMESSAKLSAPRSPNSSRSRSLGFSILCLLVCDTSICVWRICAQLFGVQPRERMDLAASEKKRVRNAPSKKIRRVSHKGFLHEYQTTL
mmetsp:Transcript_3459/g.9839  ORF Transcript_3459/g.9839 Transcript_3459/m.9839 type:complete len:360 (+) Transcript_3459:1750-2829(+)